MTHSPFSYKVRIHEDYSSLREEIELIPQRFLKGEGELIYDGRNQLRLFEIGGFRMVVKSFQVPNLLNRVCYGLVRSSKAQRSFENALLLESFGIGTPEPVAYMTFRNGLLFSRSYYVSLESSCRHTYKDLWTQEIAYQDQLMEEIGRMTACLHENGWLHKDYSRGNILFDKMQDGTLRLEIVDLNRMRKGHVSITRGCRNFERLPATESMRGAMARGYATARGFDIKKCVDLMRHFRSRQKDLVDGKY